ncbi:MAG: glycosyltransferase family 2 protein [Gemmataceae bacterium]|nr:glycosyltransferase [Gemmata sp.]MDW8197809.1 glycosyltransferase family 2 protein [Gemmataceae bacterium]
MSGVRFSVVIPTRERAETLRYALQTCLDQNYEPYEIIVSDNHSSPATKAVVEELASPKIRYIRTSEPVAMSVNWEYAVAHARGDYVLVIGDDDGLLPHALPELDRLANSRDMKALRWSPAYYTWPTIALPGQGNYLRLPMSTVLEEREGVETIRQVARFEAFYTELPMLYNAAVRRDVLDELRQRVGRIFPHPIPDVYSGFAVAYVSQRFWYTTAPMTISGQSHASNGIATLFNRGRSAIDREFHELNARCGLYSERCVPDLPVFPHVPVADAFAFAKRVLFPELDVTLDRQELTRACIRGARVTADEWPATLARLRESLADDIELQRWFDRELAHAPYHPPPPVELRPSQLGFDGTQLHLDTAAWGVMEVAAAARLCEQLLHYRDRPIHYDTCGAESVAARTIAQWMAICDERERTIHQLHRASSELLAEVQLLKSVCDEREAIIHQLDQRLKAYDAEVHHLLQQLESAQRRWSVPWPLRVLQPLLRRIGVRRS